MRALYRPHGLDPAMPVEARCCGKVTAESARVRPEPSDAGPTPAGCRKVGVTGEWRTQDPGHRRGRLHRLPSGRAGCSTPGHQVLVVDNYYSGTRANLADVLSHPQAGDHAARRDVPALRRGRRDLPPGLPGVAGVLPARPRPDDQDLGDGLDQHARPGQADEGQDPAVLDVGGVRRPGGPPAGGDLLGQRQPDRHPVLLRRGQAVRGDAVLRLPPPARHADQGGAHLQHLRSGHAARRRPGGLQLHRLRAARASR